MGTIINCIDFRDFLQKFKTHCTLTTGKSSQIPTYWIFRINTAKHGIAQKGYKLFFIEKMD
jgi:hypothetical protein